MKNGHVRPHARGARAGHRGASIISKRDRRMACRSQTGTTSDAKVGHAGAASGRSLSWWNEPPRYNKITTSAHRSTARPCRALAAFLEQEIFENEPPLLRRQRAVATAAGYLAIQRQRHCLHWDDHVGGVTIRAVETSDLGLWHVQTYVERQSFARPNSPLSFFRSTVNNL
jgi:hypothetical protein